MAYSKSKARIEQSGIRMPLGLKLQLEQMASEKGFTLNAFMLLVLHQYINPRQNRTRRHASK